MQIIKLPPGEEAAEDHDCIKISSALAQCDDEDQGDPEAVISSETYDTYEEAEAAGLAWASGLCVERIYVETSG